MFIPEGIQLYEVLPKQFYEEEYPTHGNRLWMMFDYELLLTVHHMRKRYGTVYLNNWYWGGDKQYRGWRPFHTTVGAYLSQHKFGRAVDMVFKFYSAERIRNDILASPYSTAFKFITGIEMEVSWVHIDVGNRYRHQSHLSKEVIQKIYP